MRYLLALASIASILANPAHAQALKRPNILWIVAEDMGPHFACYGTKQVATPNLDRLAGQGVRYTRFYTTAPVCSPSRSAWMRLPVGSQEKAWPR